MEGVELGQQAVVADLGAGERPVGLVQPQRKLRPDDHVGAVDEHRLRHERERVRVRVEIGTYSRDGRCFLPRPPGAPLRWLQPQEGVGREQELEFHWLGHAAHIHPRHPENQDGTHELPFGATERARDQILDAEDWAPAGDNALVRDPP